MQHRFQKRGAPKTCGYCSRKYRCRNRRTTEIADKKGLPMHCSRKEVEILNEECPGTEPCVLSTVDGGCPPPAPIHGWVFKSTIPPPTPPSVFTPANGRNRTRRRIHEKQRRKRQAGTNSMQGYPQPPLPYSGGGQAGFDHNQGLIAFQNDTLGPADQWNCAKNRAGNKCLCCCGFYFPDIQSETCRSAKELFAPVQFHFGQRPQFNTASQNQPVLGEQRHRDGRPHVGHQNRDLQGQRPRPSHNENVINNQPFKPFEQPSSGAHHDLPTRQETNEDSNDFRSENLLPRRRGSVAVRAVSPATTVTSAVLAFLSIFLSTATVTL